MTGRDADEARADLGRIILTHRVSATDTVMLVCLGVLLLAWWGFAWA